MATGPAKGSIVVLPIDGQAPVLENFDQGATPLCRSSRDEITDDRFHLQLIPSCSGKNPKLPFFISGYYEFCKIYMTDYTGDAYVKDLVFGDNPQETMHNFVFNIGYEW